MRFLLALFLFSTIATSDLNQELITKALLKCCPYPNLTKCCSDRLIHSKKFDCSTNYTRNLEIADCSDRVFYEKLADMKSFRSCCYIFQHSEFDPNNHCFSECQDLSIKPSFGIELKLETLKMCVQPNRLFGCFIRCVNDTINGESFNLLESCSLANRIDLTKELIIPNENELKEIANDSDIDLKIIKNIQIYDN